MEYSSRTFWFKVETAASSSGSIKYFVSNFVEQLGEGLSVVCTTLACGEFKPKCCIDPKYIGFEVTLRAGCWWRFCQLGGLGRMRGYKCYPLNYEAYWKVG